MLNLFKFNCKSWLRFNANGFEFECRSFLCDAYICKFDETQNASLIECGEYFFGFGFFCMLSFLNQFKTLELNETLNANAYESKC